MVRIGFTFFSFGSIISQYYSKLLFLFTNAVMCKQSETQDLHVHHISNDNNEQCLISPASTSIL